MVNRKRGLPLTPRQREVARLISYGLTNAEIAKRLVVDVSTVNNHVVHIMARLGFHRRAQIAAWVVEHGLHHQDSPGRPRGSELSAQRPGLS